MAGGVVVPDGVSAVDYGGGLTLSVFMTCLVAASGGLIFGYDIGISGTVHLTLLWFFLVLKGHLVRDELSSFPLLVRESILVQFLLLCHKLLWSIF
jgi:hypothetical protein